jgi:hypothetical protein
MRTGRGNRSKLLRATPRALCLQQIALGTEREHPPWEMATKSRSLARQIGLEWRTSHIVTLTTRGIHYMRNNMAAESYQMSARI